MNDQVGIALEYERILLKKQKIFSRAYNREGVPEARIIPIFQYVFRDILKWDAERVKNYINIDILNLLKLGKLANRLDIPPEININRDTFYLACKIYPDQVRFSRRNLVLYIYEQALNKKRQKIPRNFFEHEKGHMNACICLQYSLSKHSFRSVEELYQFFEEGRKVRKFLREVQLYDYYTFTYDYPVDFLHDCLSDRDKSDFYYNFIRFQSARARKPEVKK